MLAHSVRQMVTVGAHGRIEFDAPELEAGTRVEVLVTPQTVAPATDPASRRAAFDELRRSMALTPEAAAAWMQEVRAMREDSSEKRMSQVDAGHAAGT